MDFWLRPNLTELWPLVDFSNIYDIGKIVCEYISSINDWHNSIKLSVLLYIWMQRKEFYCDQIIPELWPFVNFFRYTLVYLGLIVSKLHNTSLQSMYYYIYVKYVLPYLCQYKHCKNQISIWKIFRHRIFKQMCKGGHSF